MPPDGDTGDEPTGDDDRPVARLRDGHAPRAGAEQVPGHLLTLVGAGALQLQQKRARLPAEEAGESLASWWRALLSSAVPARETGEKS